MMNRICTCLAITAFMLTGCGGAQDDLPELSAVTGIITLDGQPLSGASVVFESQEEGRGISAAQTDEQGHYELMFGAGTYAGAKPGKHLVRIKTEKVTTDDAGNETRSKELLPPKYNYNTELVVTVTTEKTEGYDFELKSK